MIQKITMSNVASYKNPVVLETDKKVNLIYGLNGTGKSVLSNFLYNTSDPQTSDHQFSKCSIEELKNNEEILVYNQKFISDHFYEPENLKGIFTLSKENKEAKEKVNAAEEEIKKLDSLKETKTHERAELEKELKDKKGDCAKRTWEIKEKYADGKSVLEYCLEGFKGAREKLFNHILSIKKTEEKPVKTIEELKKEVKAVKGSNAQKFDLLPQIKFSENAIEKNELLQKQVVGNQDSPIAELIKNLGNSDWIKQGLGFLPESISQDGELCPFCQQKITVELINQIKNFFDESYESDTNDISDLMSRYEEGIDRINNQKNEYTFNPFVNKDKKDKFENLFDGLIATINENKDLIIEKYNAPGKIIILTDSTEKLKDINKFIDDINLSITEHNRKIDNKDATLGSIKNIFWSIIRWDYDQTISSFSRDEGNISKEIGLIDEEVKNIDKERSDQQTILTEEQKKTINIEGAIDNINTGLSDLGIDGFKIEKYRDELYQIKRDKKCTETFKTLSEGEKMIISFLYFRELCKGKKSADSQSNKKIVLIDDPISSLSHVYIFNVGQMIRSEFIDSPSIDQLFLLTHSLYFFYEMAYRYKEKREENQKLFRLLKNNTGTQLTELKYKEIQNDYHSYWYIIKDNKQPDALIANCMRNIIEYFFNFIEKKDLNNVFQKKELKETRFQAFYRYVNRESHSSGQNIFDLKEFNYDDFKEAFKLVFIKSGYEEHYNKMIGK